MGIETARKTPADESRLHIETYSERMECEVADERLLVGKRDERNG